MLDFFAFQVRPRVLYKPGLVNELAHEVGRLGCRRALIVADAGVLHAGLLDRVRAGLAAGVEVAGVFSDVPAHASLAAVERGAAYARTVNADLIIAIGEDAPMDTAKCLRALLAEGGALRDYQAAAALAGPLAPLVAIPTTAGTGSEVTPFARIRDEAAQMMTFSSPLLAPDLTVLDPELTRSLPPLLTAATGMDALTHAIEAFVSAENNWISDSLALQTIDTVSNNLRAATFNGDDMQARGLMLIASCMAGMAYSNSLAGVVHALAHAVGGLFDVHHGTANAILLPHGMRFNSAAARNRFARIARAMGVNAGGRAEERVIEDGIAAVSALAADCALPSRLRDVGVPEAALPAIAEGALADTALATNPRTATADDLLAILRAAW